VRLPRRSALGNLDALSAGGLGLAGIGYLVYGRRYPLDTLAAPGPGLFPTVVGVLLVLLATGLLLSAWITPAPAGQARNDPAGGGRGDRPLLLMAMLGAGVALMPVIGFLASSFVLVVVSSRLLGADDWLRPVALGLAVIAGAYLLFVRWLAIPFPRGLAGY
jgi:putative tricarboxylic transport membrane protein